MELPQTGERLRVCGSFLRALLAFVGSVFEEGHTGKNECKGRDTHNCGSAGWQIADQESRAAAEGAKEIQRENRTAMTEAEVGQAMSGVILARRGKRQKAATRARNGHQRGIKNGDAQNENRDEPGGQMTGALESQFQR
jgi:hypothetical protein